MIVRPAESRDMAALAAIYGHHVLHGFGTFEEVPPSADELEARRQAVVARGLPYLLAEEAGRVLGFASVRAPPIATRWRTASTSRPTCRDAASARRCSPR